jgi:DNA-binding LacI/PurR family transcriptional regulator
MNHPAATMRDVALRAKVSVSTVSLALRNSPLVAEATRAHIRGLAEQLRYRTHPLVAAHMRSRRKPKAGIRAPVLALVDTQRERHGWRDNRTTLLRQMLAGARAQAATRGYQAREFWLHEPGMSHARFSDILHARGIHGVLLGPSSDLHLELALTWDWFSVVRLGSARVSPLLHRVINDHYQSTTLAAQRLAQLGYRRPLLVVREPLSECHERRWEAGLQTACAHLPGMRPVPALLPPKDPESPTIRHWLDRHRPDVIIDADERNVMDQLSKVGLRPPDDISVLSLSAPMMGGPISGCVQDGHAMGAAAIDLLISMIERNETGVPAMPMTLSTYSAWNPGETLRRA